MDPITQQTVTAAAGAGGDSVYVDDVFSTYLYDGTYSAQSINNGIDLAGEGGLVWLKQRDVRTRSHALIDTARGSSKRLSTNDNEPEYTSSAFITSFNNNGFSIGVTNNINQSGAKFASWSFRKAPGFFDVVTWTGNGANRTIAHDLGSVPGMILIKCTSHAANWTVYHRSIGATKHLTLDETYAETTSAYKFNNTEPTSSVFTIGVGGNSVNTSGYTYVAYIFAHDDASFGTDEDESIIKCGSFSYNGARVNVNLGWEPQYIITKSLNASGTWLITDAMRGAPVDGNTSVLNANLSVEESLAGYPIHPTSTGLTVDTGYYASGTNVIYMAIRRPNKPPEVATEVFAIDYGNGSSTIPAFDSGFPVDFAIAKVYGSTDSNETITRLTGTKALKTDTPAAEVDNGANWVTDSNAGWGKVDYTSTRISWMFKRAPGFFDVAAYTGTGSVQNINHNLGAVPEMIIIKNRDVGYDWTVYHKDLDNANQRSLRLTDASPQTSMFSYYWNNTYPTSTVFTVNILYANNQDTKNHIAYLFATLPGISKVGSYDGSSSDINIDCGFTNGARFVLIKRTDAIGDWCVFDTTRGIVSGNDPKLTLNGSGAQDTGNDLIDPLSSGFTIPGGNSFVNNINAGAKYIFLAIA